MPVVPLVLAFDRRVLLGAGVTLRSLFKSALPSTRYEVHILHHDLPVIAQADLRFLACGTGHTVNFHGVDRRRFATAPVSRGSWREIVYFRLLAHEVLPDVDRALYSDVDVCVLDDLAAIHAGALCGAWWAGVPAELNTPRTLLHQHFPENAKPCIHMTGFMLMDLAAMRAGGMTERVFAGIRRYGSRLRMFDLDLLNLVSDTVASAPLRYVTLESLLRYKDITCSRDYRFLRSVHLHEEIVAAARNPAIVHYAGEFGKPWQRRRNPAYYESHVEALPDSLKRITFRDVRKIWMRTLRERFSKARPELIPIQEIHRR